DDDIHSYHDDHQEDDAPPDGEKRVKRHKASKRSKSAKGSSFKHSAKDFITSITVRQQKVVEGNKDDDDYEDSIYLEIHKHKPKYVDDNDDKGAEKHELDRVFRTKYFANRPPELLRAWNTLQHCVIVASPNLMNLGTS
nr:hypothetical protein [Tanacetum cinerariifolium]